MAAFVRLHINALDNPKTATLSLATRGVWATALMVAGRLDQDGALPPPDQFALMAHLDADQVAKAYLVLEEKRLIDRAGSAYRIHDWIDWQPPRAEYPSDSPEARRERKRRQRERERADVTSVTSVTSRDNGVSRDVTTVTSRDTRDNGVTRGGARARVGVEPSVLSLKKGEENARDVAISSSPSHGHGGVEKRARAAQTPEETAMVVALMKAAGLREGATLTKSSRETYLTAASEIIEAGGTPEEVPMHAEHYGQMFDATITAKSLAKYWPDTAEPPARTRTGPQRPVTYARANLEERAMAMNAVDQVIGVRANGVRSDVQTGNDGPRGRIRKGG